MSGLKRLPKLETLRKLPKIELHAHLNASINANSFQKLLRQKNLSDDISFLDCNNMDEAFNRAFKLLA
jgi:adenosine deaminase